MDWKDHIKNLNNNILQLIVTYVKYNIEMPYQDDSYGVAYGTGFIVDIVKGIIVTNASTVANAVTITGRISKLGQRDLNIKILGICREKDLALCRIESEDINYITRDLNKSDITILNMKFGDNMYVDYTDEVIILSYPSMSNHITSVTGIISGTISKNIDDIIDGEIEDAIDRLPACIQIIISANLNINSGPVINKKGEVIGIMTPIYNNNSNNNNNNINYAIPARTLLAIYDNLLKEMVVKMPTLSLKWNKTNPNLMKFKTGDSKNYGIYIRNINPDSCLDQLQTGDIIRQLEYHDVFWAGGESFDVTKRTGDNSLFLSLSKVKIICYFDRYGDFNIYSESVDNDGKKSYAKISKRIIGFSEVVDMIPIGSTFWMEICRDGEWYKIETTHVHCESNRIAHIYPKFIPYEYEIFAGICCINLDRCHINHFKNLSYIINDDRQKFKKQVIIVHVFPSSEAYKVKTLKSGQIIDKINGATVSTINDIREIFNSLKSSSQKDIAISTTNKSYFIISFDEAIRDDKLIFSNFSLHKYNNNSDHKYILE